MPVLPEPPAAKGDGEGAGYARPEVLAEPDWLWERRDDYNVRVIDCGGSGNACTLEAYGRAHIPGADASGIDFLPFTGLEQSVREDVEKMRSSPFIPRDLPVSGFNYDVRTGRLHQVVRATAERPAIG